MGACLDILRLIGALFYSYFEALVFLFVSRKRKAVANDIVLITGAGHGIGREIAFEFGRLGAKVVLWDLNKVGLILIYLSEIWDIYLISNQYNMLHPFKKFLLFHN